MTNSLSRQSFPPSEVGRRGTFFYKENPQCLWREDAISLEDLNELMDREFQVLTHFSKSVKRLIKKSGCKLKQSRAQCRFFQRF